jgi:hypothetical protein
MSHRKHNRPAVGSLHEVMSTGQYSTPDRPGGPSDVARLAADQPSVAVLVSGEDEQMSLLTLDPADRIVESVPARSHACPDTVAAAVSTVWSGALMARTRISGRLVRPVVEVLPAALDRVRVGMGAELQRSTLALWESWPADMGQLPPGRPLRIVGFVAERRWHEALSTAGELCGYAPSLLVRRTVPSQVRLAEADYHGITVVVVRAEGAPRIVVAGRLGPVAGAERTVALRQHEEQLFAELISQGRLSLTR